MHLFPAHLELLPGRLCYLSEMLKRGVLVYKLSFWIKLRQERGQVKMSSTTIIIIILVILLLGGGFGYSRWRR